MVLKYWVGVQQWIAVSHGQVGIFSLGWQKWTDNCEDLLPSRCPAGKPHGLGGHQNTTRKKWTEDENKIAISCYLKATKESKRGYRKRIYNLWNEMEMLEIEEQHLVCQVRSIFKNKRLTEIKIQQLWKEIENDEIAPE